MNKEEVLFQPWVVWYCHYHLDKTVGNAKAITVTKDFTGHMSLASRATPQKTPNAYRQLSGNMTNNQFSSLHAHSEIVTVLEG